jgi:hypothetical protein
MSIRPEKKGGGPDIHALASHARHRSAVELGLLRLALAERGTLDGPTHSDVVSLLLSEADNLIAEGRPESRDQELPSSGPDEVPTDPGPRV